MKKPLNLAYKGDREYLHGTDFFNALASLGPELLGRPGVFVGRLIFRRFARRACELTTTPPSESEKVIGQVQYRSPEDTKVLQAWLVETEAPVVDRRAFDESVVLANASIDETRRNASLPRQSIYTPIEDIIALTKHLHYAVSSLKEGKWVFGQLDLSERLAESYMVLEIKIRNLIADRFSVSEIVLDGRQIGTIRFIVGSP